MVSVTITQTKNRTKGMEINRANYAHLKGIRLSISEGSRRYNVPQPTISRWINRGLITVLGTDKNRVLIDEGDLAYCAAVYHNNKGQGKWLFDQKGNQRK